MSGPFLAVPSERLAALRETIGCAMAMAAAVAVAPMCHDDGVEPHEMLLALIDAHIAGLASACLSTSVALNSELPFTLSEIADAAIERLRSNLAEAFE